MENKNEAEEINEGTIANKDILTEEEILNTINIKGKTIGQTR